MLADKRRRGILEAIQARGSVSNSELAQEFGVSGETIRRDIIRLDRKGLLNRTHGGALSVETFEPVFTERMSVNLEEKRAIGRLAASLVWDGATVVIDFGTTAYCIAQALADHSNLTVVTAGLQVAELLAGRNGNDVYLLGGQLQALEGAALGRDATEMLARYYADFSFVGAGVVSPDLSLMDFSREAAELRGLMLAHASNPVILADHSKFGRVATHRVANFEKAAYLVTDSEPSAATVRALKSRRTEVLVAEPEKGAAGEVQRRRAKQG